MQIWAPSYTVLTKTYKMSTQKQDIICLQVETSRILPLRHAILRPGLPFETASFGGDDESTTKHFAAFIAAVGSEPLCCVSYMQIPFEGKPAIQLRGMATHADFHGQGIGKTLLEHAEETILSESTEDVELWCNAREVAIGFYEKQGWVCVSDMFDIPTAGPHKIMTKILKKK